MAVVFLDLDGFKNINDRHGHLCGSRSLFEVGNLIRGAVREEDVVSRYGGDEFVVVLPDTDEDVKKLVETVMSDSWSFPDSRP